MFKQARLIYRNGEVPEGQEAQKTDKPVSFDNPGDAFEAASLMSAEDFSEDLGFLDKLGIAKKLQNLVEAKYKEGEQLIDKKGIFWTWYDKNGVQKREVLPMYLESSNILTPKLKKEIEAYQKELAVYEKTKKEKSGRLESKKEIEMARIAIPGKISRDFPSLAGLDASGASTELWIDVYKAIEDGFTTYKLLDNGFALMNDKSKEAWIFGHNRKTREIERGKKQAQEEIVEKEEKTPESLTNVVDIFKEFDFPKIDEKLFKPLDLEKISAIKEKIEDSEKNPELEVNKGISGEKKTITFGDKEYDISTQEGRAAYLEASKDYIAKAQEEQLKEFAEKNKRLEELVPQINKHIFDFVADLKKQIENPDDPKKQIAPAKLLQYMTKSKQYMREIAKIFEVEDFDLDNQNYLSAVELVISNGNFQNFSIMEAKLESTEEYKQMIMGLLEGYSDIKGGAPKSYGALAALDAYMNLPKVAIYSTGLLAGVKGVETSSIGAFIKAHSNPTK